MKITQIRSATLLIEYACKKFLIDPMLAPKGTYPGFPGSANAHLYNPLVELPLPIEQILDVDAVIVTHTHLDHWDDEAAKLIPKNIPIFTPHSKDADIIRHAGFSDVRLMNGSSQYAGIRLIKTAGQHGSEQAFANPVFAERMGEVCGVIFQHQDEKTMYLAGDTVWNSDVSDSLAQYAPEVIILNVGDAHILGAGAIIMGKDDVLRAHMALPKATIFATHLEALNHCLLSRAELREFVAAHHIESNVRIPDDGESCQF